MNFTVPKDGLYQIDLLVNGITMSTFMKNLHYSDSLGYSVRLVQPTRIITASNYIRVIVDGEAISTWNHRKRNYWK